MTSHRRSILSYGVLSLFSIFFLSLFCFRGSASAIGYDISSFGLNGQATYGAANAWYNNLSYSGRNMYSVWRWEVRTPSITTQGKYATINISGSLRFPLASYRVTTSQGFSVTQCAVGSSAATLSNTRTSWSLAQDGVLNYTVSTSAEFSAQSLTGQLFCTMTSNAGTYVLTNFSQASQAISFGTTNFTAEWNNTLSEELLQQQINQNQTIINQNQQIINQGKATQDYLTDDTPPDPDTDNLPSVGLLPAGPIDSLLGLPLTLMTNISSALGGSCSGLNIPLPFINENLPIPCFDTIFYSGDFAPLATILGTAASAVILFYWLKHLYKKVDRAVSMETTDEDEWGVL